MKVLYVTTWDCFGIQFNGYLLSKSLRQNGYDAKMLVAKKAFDDPNISQLGASVFSKLDPALIKLENFLSLQRLLTLSFGEIFSHPWYKEADIIHFQLPHAIPFLNLLMVPRISQEKKMVWTVHDPWLVSGHCVYPMGCERWKIGCGKCPDLSINFALKSDATAFNWKMKKNAIKKSSIHLVVASQWMQDLITQSPITSHLPSSIIPFGIDNNVFYPKDKAECRKKLNITEDAYVLSCRWVSSNPFKGVKYIERALALLAFDKPVYIITFDAGSQGTELKDRYHFIDLGWVIDQKIVAEALSASDIFLMPSTAEAFGLMAIESMACGTPVIVFEGTALPGVIHAPRGGLAVPRDSEKLAEAIRLFLADPERREMLSREGLNIVNKEYKIESYINKHMDLYRTLLSKSSNIV